MNNNKNMKIWFKGDYELSTEKYFQTSLKKSTFLVPLKNQKISVSIDFVNKKIEPKCQYEITDELYNWIINIPSQKKTEEPLPSKIKEINSDFDFSTKRVISIIKYNLNHYEINDNLLLRDLLEWSENDLDYKYVEGTAFDFGWYRYDIDIDDKAEKNIQEYLNREYSLFTALKFLHRSIREDNPTFKIIDATIAAEIAIKEFLIEKNKAKLDLRLLLLELPSPPLEKLYGRILKFYGDEDTESPKKDIIKMGSEVRNILIHSPNELDISYEIADFYCQTVQYAIFHLLFLLYPKDDSIKKILDSYTANNSESYQNRMKQELKHILEEYRAIKTHMR